MRWTFPRFRRGSATWRIGRFHQGDCALSASFLDPAKSVFQVHGVDTPGQEGGGEAPAPERPCSPHAPGSSAYDGLDEQACPPIQRTSGCRPAPPGPAHPPCRSCQSLLWDNFRSTAPAGVSLPRSRRCTSGLSRGPCDRAAAGRRAKTRQPRRPCARRGCRRCGDRSGTSSRPGSEGPTVRDRTVGPSGPWSMAWRPPGRARSSEMSGDFRVVCLDAPHALHVGANPFHEPCVRSYPLHWGDVHPRGGSTGL